MVRHVMKRRERILAQYHIVHHHDVMVLFMHDEDDYYFFHAKIACQDRAQGFQEIPSHIIIFESKKSKTKRQTFFLNIFSSTSTVTRYRSRSIFSSP